MTDNEVKTPNKRKSFAAQTPGKKPKLENGGAFTPSKKGFNKNTPKQKSPKQNQKNALPKKVKAFEGTVNLQDKKMKNKKEGKEAGEQQVTSEGKKKRKNQFSTLLELIRSDDPNKKKEGVKKLEDKIKTIESRPEQTKTSKRKLNWLKTQKNILEGKPPREHLKSNLKTESQKRRERKQKADKNAVVKQEKGKAGKKQKQKPVKTGSDDEESSEEEETNEVAVEGDSGSGEEEAEGESDSGEESGDEEAEEQSGEEDDDDENGDQEEDSDDDESEDEAPKLVAPKDTDSKAASNKSPKPENRKKTQNPGTELKNSSEKKPDNKEKKDVSVDDLKKKDLITKGQKRFVLFVGNIPYDTTKQDLIGHFSKAGEIVDIRIPSDKKSNKPRGFAYLELTNEETYQKCLSMHHSSLKNRRLNVLYTQGGKKKGDDKKKEIKAKNMKLHAMRNRGQLAGSVKESNRRSFRRAKQRDHKQKEAENNN